MFAFAFGQLAWVPFIAIKCTVIEVPKGFVNFISFRVEIYLNLDWFFGTLCAA